MKRHLQLVEQYQCPGCAVGTAASDGCYQAETDPQWGLGCARHAPGTRHFTWGLFALGLPLGFNRAGEGRLKVRIYATRPLYNHFNVAVWARRFEDVVLVRTYLPRLNATFVDVLDDGGDLPAGAVDVTNVEMD